MSIAEQTTSSPPTGCPVAHDFDPFEHEAHDFFAEARKNRPVFYHPPLDAYVVTRYKDCERVLRAKDDEVSAKAALEPNVPMTPEAGQILMESGFVPAPSVVDEDGMGHRLHRWAIQADFLPVNVAYLEEFVRRQVASRLDAIVGVGEADIVDALIYEVPATVILKMMGVDEEDMGMVKYFRGPWGVFGWGYPTGEDLLTVANGIAMFGAWARELAADRIANRGEDIISHAVTNLQEAAALDMNWLHSYTLNVVMAGHETTTNTFAGGVRSLLSDPAQWAALVAEPALCENAVEEILRHDTGVPTWRQRAVRDIELSGVTIPAGAKIYCALNSANRDEEIFGSDAESFDVRREDARRHIAFGTGAHACLGKDLARLEMRWILEDLTRRLPHLELVPGQTYTYSPNTSQRGPEHVLVRWDPTKNPLPGDRP